MFTLHLLLTGVWVSLDLEVKEENNKNHRIVCCHAEARERREGRCYHRHSLVMTDTAHTEHGVTGRQWWLARAPPTPEKLIEPTLTHRTPITHHTSHNKTSHTMTDTRNVISYM